MNDITFITGNPGKVEQVQRYLQYPLAHASVDLHEIQSLDLAAVVEHKARGAYEYLQQPVLIEDTSVRFHALGALPGPFIKWFLSELGNEGLCTLLDGYEDRSATATALFGLYDGGELHTFTGSLQGTIADRPLGENGFGWDPIFIPSGYTLTLGQMDISQQVEVSMRKQALTKLDAYLAA